MLTRDGIRLDADVYWPDADGPFPVLLMRQPYGRDIASTVVYAHPTWYAAQGFIVVIQDVRGRGTSDGIFQLFQHEIDDGFDTVQWAAQLPRSSGQVGMYGFSYQGMTQLFAAQAKPPALKAIAPAMVGCNLLEDWAYENGALMLQTCLGWAIQIAAESARLKNDHDAFQALYQASRQLPLHSANPTAPPVLVQYAPDSFFHDWVRHSKLDDYWQGITPQLDLIDLPMLHVGGWFDPYLRGNIRLYQNMVTYSSYPQYLWIGPWGHIPWGQVVGARNYGAAANNPIDRLQVDWFKHFLYDFPEGRWHRPSVNLFEMGTNHWRPFPEWPQGSQQQWALISEGLASMDQQDGRLIPLGSVLAPRSPEDASPDTVPSTAVDTWVHDPWRPVPSLGGHAAIPAGSFDRLSLDCRSDVLTYTSLALTEPLHIAGHCVVIMHCQSDRPSFDLCVTLSEVRPDGAVFLLTQGYGRFYAKPNTWATQTVTMQPTCCCIQADYAIRLSISAACYPAYALNPGTGDAETSHRMIDAKIITLSMQSGIFSQSRLQLPVIPPS